MNDIGNQIKQLRKRENLTQKEFSRRLLISQSYLSALENGNEIPTSKLLKLICLEFGVNEQWLINNSGEMYDEVFENEKSFLVEISNSALLKIMNMLSTKSNVEYGFYANSLDLFSLILDNGKFLDEETRLLYLELFQNFIMNFERMVHIAIKNNDCEILDNHKKGLFDDIEQIVSIFKDKI